MAPLSSEHQAYLNGKRLGTWKTVTEDGHGLGYIPARFDLPALKKKPSGGVHAAATFPATFDLRSLGKLTEVRDQGLCGACWAFSNLASLESSLLPTEIWDFSENNMKDFLGTTCCLGGNRYNATSYMASWHGPIPEALDPYSDTSCDSPSALAPAKLVTDVLFLPARTGPLDNDTIKEALMTYGAVATTMFYTSTSYNSATYAFYGTITAANHGVAIVGWDDNFDKAKFRTPPPGNGAFLIRNSWGPNWGDHGYFWVSYYDGCVGKDNTVFPPPQESNPYTGVYEYDKYGWSGSLGFSSETGWMANVFTAKADEFIGAVSWYCPAPDSPFEIRMYRNPAPNSPVAAAGPVFTQTGTVATAGYHLLPLTAAIPVSLGETFSVIVKLTTPGDNYPMGIESSSRATANRGESYCGSNGTTWWDLQDVMPNSNILVRAYAVGATARVEDWMDF